MVYSSLDYGRQLFCTVLLIIFMNIYYFEVAHLSSIIKYSGRFNRLTYIH